MTLTLKSKGLLVNVKPEALKKAFSCLSTSYLKGKPGRILANPIVEADPTGLTLLPSAVACSINGIFRFSKLTFRTYNYVNELEKDPAKSKKILLDVLKGNGGTGKDSLKFILLYSYLMLALMKNPQDFNDYGACLLLPPQEEVDDARAAQVLKEAIDVLETRALKLEDQGDLEDSNQLVNN